MDAAPCRTYAGHSVAFSGWLIMTVSSPARGDEPAVRPRLPGRRPGAQVGHSRTPPVIRGLPELATPRLLTNVVLLDASRLTVRSWNDGEFSSSTVEQARYSADSLPPVGSLSL